MKRFLPITGVAALTLVVLGISVWRDARGLWLLLILLPLLLVGIYDLVQRQHSLRRNYPLIGRTRWLFEGVRPEIRQYLLESDEEPVPFSREQRTVVYERAKGMHGKRPFGTHLDLYRPGATWLTHSVVPRTPTDHDFRVTVGGGACRQPYSASVYNISAMSFGALSANAICALNKGARFGGFAHDTGEGGVSRYHREFGGDLIWEIGSGYFGCRTRDGAFDPASFAEQAALEQIRMIEIKLSQGAKPGHGGVLPAAKVTPEIAKARRVPVGVDCISPPAHKAFSSPLELMAFIERLRELSGGKPVGFKLCLGQPWEFFGLIKAMLATGTTPDFIVVDGSEGGTGAAPPEFTNHVGTPLRDALVFVRNALTGAGLRDRVRLAASGKLVTAFDLATAMALGADWCNSARAFMFALGCIQAQTCHTNRCPVGVATQDPWRQRALDVEDKAQRIADFHRNTLVALAELLASAGIAHPADLSPELIQVRRPSGDVVSAADAFPRLAPGELLAGTANPLYRENWRMARAETFTPLAG